MHLRIAGVSLVQILAVAALWSAPIASGCDRESEPVITSSDSEPQWPDTANEQADVAEPEVPDTGPEPPDIDETPDTSPDPADVAVAPDQNQPEVQVPDPIRPPPLQRFRERLPTGRILNRQIRLETHYQVEVRSGLAASASGASERVRTYSVEIGVTSLGRVQHATISVEQDSRRVLPQGDQQLTGSLSDGPLAGQVFDCALTDDRWSCGAPALSGQRPDLVGVFPHRLNVLPLRPATLGETWVLTGRQAESFLGDGAEADVHFHFDQSDVLWRDFPCHHVSYTLAGSQPVTLTGRTMLAEIEGEGEYFFCDDPGLVLQHRQERNLSVETNQLTRHERIILEEETFFE